MFFEIIQNKKI